MGLDITVLTVDWAELARAPVGRRTRRLEEVALLIEDKGPGDVEGGWAPHPGPGEPWCAVYDFHDTLGSYKPHFWAGHAWDDVREFAAPELREPLDGFLGPLIWEGPDRGGCAFDDELFPPGAEHRTPLVCCRPETVTALAGYWSRAAPLLDGLREAYAEHAARPGRWIADFDEFTSLLRQWGEVVGEADRRGWGLVGLPW